MSVQPILQGIHHITAIAGDPARNLRFYRDVLGLRLVKKTVNFDDPFTYHFYFGDELGSPGTILTFFPWADARRGSLGAGMIETVSFAIPPGAGGFWRERLARAGVVVSDRPPAADGPGLRFSDPDGLQLELVEVAVEDAGAVVPWAHVVPGERAIRSFRGVTARVRELGPTADFLQEKLGYTPAGGEGARRRYRTSGAGRGFFELLADPAAPVAIGGTGTVHHIAWMTPDVEVSLAWRARLLEAGVQVSPLMDRNYFKSVYFREPAGVLFELATNGPGFAVDEPPDRLGASLKLPAQYEAHRAGIEKRLPPLDRP